ncbi:hypothetical protein DSM21852_13330 [Methylocystis bryophila]|uniref:TonB C-terminal domain-containing protein n=2 Tax=Methylocystis bryophila TaxID=655015 RepID=A0A1W6MWM0_9HYPH|nr:hypothetical protein B1812_13805 [Methylocystis bryophila]BDV38080.1 hypothetical protein DSM21852_13330 [Methylocystis bryophila]
MAASLAIHLAALLIAAWALAPVFDEAELLIVEYSGAEASEQSEAKLKEQTGGLPGSRADNLQPRPMTQAVEDLPSDTAMLNAKFLPATEQRAATPAKDAPASPGALEVAGTDQRQEARRIRPRPESRPDPLREYARLLTKKVMSRLVYPEAGRRAGLRGDAAVMFTILPDGALRLGSLRIVSSSGEAKLDESALQTIRASAPFDPPQREITLKITVKYGP